MEVVGAALCGLRFQISCCHSATVWSFRPVLDKENGKIAATVDGMPESLVLVETEAEATW